MQFQWVCECVVHAFNAVSVAIAAEDDESPTAFSSHEVLANR